ncbi:MAG: hypothetical protein V4467_04810 [Patescibacteria group bacterium]
MKKSKSAKSKIDVGQELRNLGVLLEKNNHEIKAVAEQYGDLQKDVSGLKKTLESHTEMIGKLAEDMTIVKVNVEFLKGSLKKKVDYDEFLALERRLSLLESKVK